MNPKPASYEELTRLFTEWQQSQERFRMALQTLQGAQAATLETEVAFKARVRLAYGPDVTFEYDQKKGLIFKQPRRRKER